MLARSKQLLEEFDVTNHPMASPALATGLQWHTDPSGLIQTKFVTGDTVDDPEKAHVGDDYFLNSGDKIRYFLEEGAVGPDGQLNRPKEMAVNKIGHGETAP